MPLIVNIALGSVWYELNGFEDDPEEDRPAVKLKQLRGDQLDQVMENSSASGDLSAKGVQSALRQGLEDWKNIIDENGNPIECKFTNHGKLPYTQRNEIAVEIVNRSQITGAEQKN